MREAYIKNDCINDDHISSTNLVNNTTAGEDMAITTGLAAPTAAPTAGKPITIAIEHLDQTRDGHFRPAAFVKLTGALRTSGFLHELPPEGLRNLLFLLTYVTPSGDCRATVLQLADAMQLSQTKVRSRMQRLEKFHWQGKPVVILVRREGGLDGYTLSSDIVAIEEPSALQTGTGASAPLRTVPRETVIAYSRQRYARPRAEVERMIAEQNEWELPEAVDGDPITQTRRRLLNLGVPQERVTSLMGGYDIGRIQRQLDWLPYRNAHHPASFIAAAIERDYEEPFELRLNRLTDASGEGRPGIVDRSGASVDILGVPLAVPDAVDGLGAYVDQDEDNNAISDDAFEDAFGGASDAVVDASDGINEGRIVPDSAG